MEKESEKEFATRKQSLALQELGFDEECMANCMGFAYDFKDGKYVTSHEQIFYPDDSITPEDIAEELDRHIVHICGIPLKQQVFRWFREKWELHVEIVVQLGFKHWNAHILPSGEWLKKPTPTGFNTYEEVENAAIDKLIELVKQQQ